jgi:hypothetical protein
LLPTIGTTSGIEPVAQHRDAEDRAGGERRSSGRSSSASTGQTNSFDNTRTIELLAQLSQTADFSVGCYCDDESRCHRSVLRTPLAERGAKFA